ncbi:MAG: hypothetical protein AB7V46_07085 [Thermomicrobiales bacterium]
MTKHVADGPKFKITDEDRKRLSPDDLKTLEEVYERLNNNEYEIATNWNADKFSAEWMVPDKGPIPDWNPAKKRTKKSQPK